MVALPACIDCARFHRLDLQHNTCDAYPAGIPAAIQSGRERHVQAFPGDHGLQYQRLGADAAHPAPELPSSA